MMEVQFSKMHGTGNSFIIVSDLSNILSNTLRRPPHYNPTSKTNSQTSHPDHPNHSVDGPAIARLCSVEYGLGADGLILIKHATSQAAHFKLVIYNAGDGSPAEMCGNAVRCVTKYLYDHHYHRHPTCILETPAGMIATELLHNRSTRAEVRVNMGRPQLTSRDFLPPASEAPWYLPKQPQLPLQAFQFNGHTGYFVSMGNPHAVIPITAPPAASSAPPNKHSQSSSDETHTTQANETGTFDTSNPSNQVHPTHALHTSDEFHRSHELDALHRTHESRESRELHESSEWYKQYAHALQNEKNLFPNGVNVGFLRDLTIPPQNTSPSASISHSQPQEQAQNPHATLRVIERGVGETASCGTGACAAAVVLALRSASVNQGESPPISYRIALKGGMLTIEWTPPSAKNSQPLQELSLQEIFMTGEAVTIASGTFTLA